MASRKLLVASIGVAAAAFSCSSSSSGNCCAPPEDTGDVVDALVDSHFALDAGHDASADVADSFADTEAIDADAMEADAASDDGSVDVLDADDASDAD